MTSPVNPQALSQRAEDLRQRVRRLAVIDTERDEAHGLDTRRTEFHRLHQQARRLVVTQAMFRTGGVHVVLNRGPLQQAATRLAGARQQFSADPRSLIQANAFDRAEFKEVLDAAERTLQQAWQRHVNAPTESRLADTLAGIPRFAPQAQRIRLLQDQLRRTTARLPSNESELRRPDEIKQQLRELIQGLSLEADELALLERAQQEGVPLRELLDNADLTERLRQRGLLDCLRVVI